MFSNLALMPFMSRPVAMASCNLILALTGLRKPAEIQSRPAGTAPSLLWCQSSISEKSAVNGLRDGLTFW